MAEGQIDAQASEQPKVTTETATPKPEDDLITRVSKAEIKPQVDTPFNVNDINNIQDSTAKAYAEKAYKSFQGDYTRKSQALAEERKAWEARKTESESWTPDKVKTLINDPNFVNAAQGVVSQPTDDYSALSDVEKKRITDNENKVNALFQQNQELLRRQQDEANKARYANYDTQAVDIITNDLLKGKVQATREHLWKVVDYNSAVQRAYELGKQDRKLDNQDKFNAMSPDGVVAVGDESVPKKEEGETDRNYIMRLYNRRAAQKSESGQVRK